MASVLLGAAIVGFGIPVLAFVGLCYAGQKMIGETEHSYGDCARGLASDQPRRRSGSRASRSLASVWASARQRRTDGVLDSLAS